MIMHLKNGPLSTAAVLWHHALAPDIALSSLRATALRAVAGPAPDALHALFRTFGAGCAVAAHLALCGHLVYLASRVDAPGGGSARFATRKKMRTRKKASIQELRTHNIHSCAGNYQSTTFSEKTPFGAGGIFNSRCPGRAAFYNPKTIIMMTRTDVALSLRASCPSPLILARPSPPRQRGSLGRCQWRTRRLGARGAWVNGRCRCWISS